MAINNRVSIKTLLFVLLMAGCVCIVDYGGQFTKVIDRRIRELCVETVVVGREHNAKDLAQYGALVLSGSPDSVTSENVTQNDRDIFALGIPILGICYGMQLMNFIYGGSVGAKSIREDGQDSISISLEHSKLFHGLSTSEKVLLTHGDSVDELAEGFTATAKSKNEIVVAIENLEANLYGVQFHPEVDLTENGQKIFENFLFRISGLTKNFSLEDREQIAIQHIQELVGDNHVLVLVSGGVDSSVCAALVAKALSHDKIHCIHIDNGFMRKDESKLVMKALGALGIQIHHVDAAETFYQTSLGPENPLRLDQTIAPEDKRRIIGDTFMRVAEESIKGFNLEVATTFLAQGTLRPDLIESAGFVSKSAAVIKTHHNDTAMVRALRDAGRVLEPLSDYHKDEVRVLGELLGLPKEMVWRQPFPGPGLAVRCLCSDGTSNNIEIAATVEKLEQFTSIGKGISSHILPVNSVGVQGDGRTYGYAVVLSQDYQSVDEIDWNHLFDLAKEIPMKLHKVNRVVFAFGGRITEQPEVVKTLMDKSVLSQLRDADYEVNSVLATDKLTSKISQMPVILIPVSFDRNQQHRSIVLRPFVTNDFMTGVPAIPGTERLPLSSLSKMIEGIQSNVENISRVLIDLTCKPPGTTEWE